MKRSSALREMENALRPEMQELYDLVIALRGLLDGGLLTALSAVLTRLKALLNSGLIEKIDELARGAQKEMETEA